MDPLSLSAECLSYIDSLDLDYERQYPSEEDREMTRVFREMTRKVLSSREGFTAQTIQEIEELIKVSPDFIVNQLDDFLTRLLLRDVSSMASRAIRLSRLDAPRQPSESTAVYILEATRTYIYGFPQASVAISRAALEQGLKECLGRQGDQQFITFQDLVNEAQKWNILDAPTAKMVRDTAKKADAVLHERPVDHDGALEVLTEVRGLLQQIYAAKGGF